MESKLNRIVSPAPDSKGSRPARQADSPALPAVAVLPATGYLLAWQAKEQAKEQGRESVPARRLSARQPQLASGAFEPLRGQELLCDALTMFKPAHSSACELREGMTNLVARQVLRGFPPDRVAVALAQALEAAFGVGAGDDKRTVGDPSGFDRLLRALFEAFGQLEGANLADLLGPVLASSGQPGTVVASWLLAQAPQGLARGDLWPVAMESLLSVADEAGKSGDWLQSGLAGVTGAQQRCWEAAAASLREAHLVHTLDAQVGLATSSTPSPAAARASCARVLGNWAAISRELCRHAATLTPAQIEDFLSTAVRAEQQAGNLLDGRLIDAEGLKDRLKDLLGTAFEADATIARCGAIVAGMRNGLAAAWPQSRALYVPRLREAILDALAPVGLALGADVNAKSDYQRFLLGRLVDGQVKAEPVSRPTPVPQAPAAALTGPGALPDLEMLD